jgi:hypothetical protein
MRTWGCLLAVGLLGGLANAADAEVTAVVAPGQVGVRIGGEPFAVFNHGAGLAKPYWFPLRAPGGHVVSALAPFDHKHHKGIWIGLEAVRDNNFWGGKYQQQDAVEPLPAKERIANLGVAVTPPDVAPLRLTIDNEWQGEQGHPVVKEQTVVTVLPQRLMVFEIRLTAVEAPVTLVDTKEGFLAVRVAPSMNAKGDGRIVNAAGQTGEEGCWGQQSPWVDYSGPVDGKTAGIALFDHPSNFRPSRYHVRAYGLFAISPFGEGAYSKGQAAPAPVTLSPGESIQLKYGLYVHLGDAAQGNVSGAYQTFLSGP